MLRLNVGCGRTPTKGWKNYDNSLSVRVANLGFLGALIVRAVPLSDMQKEFMAYIRANHIEWANAVTHIPEQAESAALIYSSHMFEHLTRSEAIQFLAEIHRVLLPGGRIRIAVPDLSKLIKEYLDHKDADKFVGDTYLAVQPPLTFCGRLKRLIVGDRHHMWMYDSSSLCRLIESHGFMNAEVFPAGETGALDPGELDLFERAAESTYVEAVKGV